MPFQNPQWVKYYVKILRLRDVIHQVEAIIENLIGSYLALKHPAVDILVSMDSARSLIYHEATIVSETTLDTDAEIACRMAKAQATDALLFAGDRAVQFHGGMGFTYECDAQLYIRRAQWSQQHFGDALHHRKRLAPLLLD
jgi:alkylation response protein AidB-like acyl-CoA dehydrogenase